MRRRAGAALALGAGILCGSAPALAQFSVQPAIMELTPGRAPAVSVLHLANEGEAEMQFRLYPVDFEQDVDGGHDFMEASRHPRSCAGRMSLSSTSVSLRAGERREIRVELGPGEATCWSLLMVESVAPGEAGIHARQRIGVKVYGSRADARRDGEIRGVALDGAAGAPAVSVEFGSSDEAPLLPRGTLEIRTFSGERVAAVPIEPFGVLPRHTRRIRVPLPGGIPPGRYLVVPILDYGGDHLAAGQLVLQLP